MSCATRHRTATLTVGALLRRLAGELPSSAEARWVVVDVLGVPARELPRYLGRRVDEGHTERALACAARRRQGEPLAYVLGSWQFRELELAVDARALVPRCETEEVVGWALAELAGPVRAVARGTLRAVDLGTGTGAIALSLALEGPDVVRQNIDGARRPGSFSTAPTFEVWGTDFSSAALELAASNLACLGDRHAELAPVHLEAGSWFGALPASLAGRVHLIVSNPPYVSASEWEGLDPDVRLHEPRVALVPGPSGLEALAEIVDEAPRWLAPGGMLVLEFAPHQAPSVVDRARRAGLVDMVVRSDLGGRARALVARRSPG